MPEPSHAELDRLIDGLARSRPAWRSRDPHARARLIRQCLPAILAASGEWAERDCRAKGIDPAAPLAGEEWLAGPMTTLRGFRLMAEALDGLDGPEPVRPTAGPGGRAVVPVFPRSVFERVLYRGIRGEVWVQPGAPATRARLYREPAACPAGEGVALVLGAGNVSSIGPLDALSLLASHGEPVLLKVSDVNRYLLPVFARAFAPLIEAGALAIVAGAGDTGAYLCAHPAVTRVHLTGSRRTYDAIMWGADPRERDERRANRVPRLTKPVTAELGCVTPMLVVPDRWTDADLRFQARHVAAMVAHNASHNCVAGKVLVVARDWPQRERFVEEVLRALRATPGRLAYYPGAQERYQDVLRRYPSARVVGPGGDGVVPWTVIPDVPPQPGEYALSEEAFCGVLAVVAVDGGDAPSFLAHAVPFVNQHVEGTLSCMLLAHPRTEAAHAGAMAQAVQDLRYGSVGINVWSGVIFGLGTTTWGAWPGHTPEDIGSGVGVVHNSFLIDHPEKSVVRAPFRMRPTPVWFADHRTLLDVGRRMTAFEAAPAWARLPGIVAAALRG